MFAQRTHPDRELFERLEGLSQEAKAERLECASLLTNTLIATLQRYDVPSAPSGFLTVDGWFNLLGQWEIILKSSTARQIDFSRSFFQEVLKRPVFNVPPLSPLLTGLVALMANHSESLHSRVAA